MEFNKYQLEAINSTDGAVQVIASAGSGKTSVLVNRIKCLVKDKGVAQNQILALSFTNAASTELKQRLNQEGLFEISTGTFHSICKQELEKNGYQNLMEAPQKYQVKREIEKLTGINNVNIDEVLSWISFQKNHMKFYTDNDFLNVSDQYTLFQFRNMYKIYENFKRRTHTYDFDDWLLEAFDLYQKGKGRKWEYVSADETQDLNIVQYKLLSLFCSTNNIFIAGDISQSLYEFRGATPKLFKEFKNELPNTKIINVPINYRSTNDIVEASNSFIEKYNSGYQDYKNAIANNKNEGIIECKVFSNKKQEAGNVFNNIAELCKNGVQYNDIAVLYRNNSSADCLESLLKKNNIPYNISANTSFFDKKEIQGIISVLRLLENKNDDEAMENLLRKARFYPLKYFSNYSIDNISNTAIKQDKSIYDCLIDYRSSNAFELKNIATFKSIMNTLQRKYNRGDSLSSIVSLIIVNFKIVSIIKESNESSVARDKIESLNNLKDIVQDYDNFTDFYSSVISNKPYKRRKDNAIELTTIHKSKGLEFKIVFLIGLEEGKFPSEKASELSEARLMYVAVTRPKEQLYISSIGNSPFYIDYLKGLNGLKDKSV